jgi:FkbM family methyltransferase
LDPFVSNAANFEDVMLWRALKGVMPGFYIDVGAHAPVSGSVSWAFYERGWSGMTIEPDPELFAAFPDRRPRDVNLNLALGSKSGEMDLSIVVDRRALSTLNEAEAEVRRLEGHTIVRRRVPVRTLAEVWDSNVAAGQPVHFLKIDVEGYEHEVLLGADWARHRPWIVVIEAARPTTEQPSHEAWEPMLLDAGYRFAYHDGLNRFYVSEAHPELLPAFAAPPNVFDGFLRASEVGAMNRARLAEEQAARARASLAAVRASASWRITAPLRAVGRLVSRSRPSGP